jgi:hypothetical protein
MQRSVRLSLSLSGVAALALAGTPLQPVAAQEGGSADDLGVMSISLKSLLKNQVVSAKMDQLPT